MNEVYPLEGKLNDLAISMRTDSNSRKLFAECIKEESTSLLDLWRSADKLMDIWDDLTAVKYRIRKLTPRECGRLMNFRENDIDQMLKVNSNSAVYQICGNSIVVACLVALFSQLHIEGITPWNELTEEERYKLVEGNGIKVRE